MDELHVGKVIGMLNLTQNTIDFLLPFVPRNSFYTGVQSEVLPSREIVPQNVELWADPHYGANGTESPLIPNALSIDEGVSTGRVQHLLYSA